jgi:hypothetical protein
MALTPVWSTVNVVTLETGGGVDPLCALMGPKGTSDGNRLSTACKVLVCKPVARLLSENTLLCVTPVYNAAQHLYDKLKPASWSQSGRSNPAGLSRRSRS